MKRQLRIPVLILLLLAAWLITRTASGMVDAQAAQMIQPIGPIVYAWSPIVEDDDDDDKDNDITPRLSVRGEAELEKPADQLRINLGVVTDGKDAEQTLEDNSEVMDGVVKAIRKAGLEDGEYQTGRFRVQPVYSRRPRGADETWQPQILGYQVTNTIDVKTTKLELAGAIIQEASKAGANSVNSINFDLADERKHRAEAIVKATTNAIDDARVVAQAAGVKLVRILSINLDDARPMASPPRSQMNMRAMAEGGVTPPITPGEVMVRASVTIVYEIDEAAAIEEHARFNDSKKDIFSFSTEIPF